MANQKGFSAFRLLIILLIIVFVLAIGAYILNKTHHTTGNAPCGNSTSITQDNITVYCPANDSTVGETFNITGTAKSGIFKLNLVIDGLTSDSNGDQWSYNKSSDFTVSGNGQFTMPIDLTGNNVLQEYIPITGGANYKYIGISPGKHTFTIDGTGGCGPGSSCGALAEFHGPTLTLYVN